MLHGGCAREQAGGLLDDLLGRLRVHPDAVFRIHRLRLGFGHGLAFDGDVLDHGCAAPGCGRTRQHDRRHRIVEASFLFNEADRRSRVGKPSTKAMFGQVFDWAGDFRTIHIRKRDENGDPSGYFTSPERIAAEGRGVIRHLEATLRRGMTDDLAPPTSSPGSSNTFRRAFAAFGLSSPTVSTTGRCGK